MTELANKHRLRPSLLDRLTDDHPERRAETVQDYTVSEVELRELVRRDLTWLFNTTHMAAGMGFGVHAHVNQSVINYGIIDLTGRTLNSIHLDELKQHVLEVLRSYEPRLIRESLDIGVHIGSNRRGTDMLIIDIEGALWAEPQPLPVHLRTEIDAETGRATVNELCEEHGR